MVTCKTATTGRGAERDHWSRLYRIAMNVHVRFENVTVTYGPKTALADVSLDIPEKRILAVIGPANSGKTTLLRCINRTIDFISTAKVRGRVLIAEREKGDSPHLPERPGECLAQMGTVPFFPGKDIFQIRNVYELRRKVGMVFPLPVGLPLSVYENVAYGPRRAGLHRRQELDPLVEKCLRQAMLWDEVKDRLDMLGTKLSGGQQQRLTLARALSLRPEILCLDEFSIRRVLDRHRPRDHDADRRHPAGTEGPDDHRAGDQPGAAGPAAGRLHRLFQFRAVDRGRRNGDNFHQGEKPTDGTLCDRRFRLTYPAHAVCGTN
jgi:ABC-type phosphate transport system ATPase subunit